MSEPDQQPTRILAIRHGETDWNVEHRIQGQLDVPLNEVGRWQLQRLALALADEAIDAVYSSDLLRALETAQAVARGCGLPIVTDVGLRERGFGEFEGLTYAEIDAHWPALAERWRKRDPSFGTPGGETLNAFYARSVATATRLAALHPGQTIALVSHGGVLDCLYRAATRVALDAPRSWQIGNAAINRLLHTPQGFTLIGWADDYHLDDGSLDESADGDAPVRPAPAAKAAA
ncbi:MAG TPA: histidine phosphatase family protein [Burkholderiaceae bacterium]|nr:histidine phosphatase family protein [Burkholderiaceae bacterium]